MLSINSVELYLANMAPFRHSLQLLTNCEGQETESTYVYKNTEKSEGREEGEKIKKEMMTFTYRVSAALYNYRALGCICGIFRSQKYINSTEVK